MLIAPLTNLIEYQEGPKNETPRCNDSLGSVFVSRMIVILCFLIVVVLANIPAYYISGPVFRDGVVFLNENFCLLLLIAILLLGGNIFFAFPFPLNLPAPIIRAIGSV
ncbi:MAG: hypothetical protein WCF90_05605 [Methanomicrobiales archaeon]